MYLESVMPVPIHKEPDGEPPMERCCFCRSVTPYWTSLSDRKLGQQVAICQHCASRADPVDVPSKEMWSRRERIARHPTFGEVARGTDRNYPPAPIVEPPK